MTSNGKVGVIILAILMVSISSYGQGPTKVQIGTVYQGGSEPLRDFRVDMDLFRQRVDVGQVPNAVNFVPRGAENLFRSNAETRPDFTRRDPVIQLGPSGSGASIHIEHSFEGTTDDDNAALLGLRIVPPDTNGDVGEKYYAQMNNLVFEVFDKKDGSSVLGPLPNTAFWTGTGSFCEAFNDGDPIVLYDHDAKRWIFSQFALFDFILSGL